MLFFREIFNLGLIERGADYSAFLLKYAFPSAHLRLRCLPPPLLDGGYAEIDVAGPVLYALLLAWFLPRLAFAIANKQTQQMYLFRARRL